MNREAWQRGPVPGISNELQPAAHALLHAREDIDRVVLGIRAEDLWSKPGASASLGYHLLHLAGSTHRLLSYARGEELTDEQRLWLEREKSPQPGMVLAELVHHVNQALDAALAQLRDTPASSLDDVRTIGRAQIRVTLRGLLFHIGEHAARHAGQIVTTAGFFRQ